MASIAQNVAAVRNAVYGREVREPIADTLILVSDSGYRKSDLDNFTLEQIQIMRDREPQLERVEARHGERVKSITNEEMQKEIDWIEITEIIIHDPPTIYSLNGNNSIIVSSIEENDYKANDSGSSVTLISEEDYKMTAGSNWSSTAIDDPTHTEGEEYIHYVPDYRLSFIRANES